MKGVGRQKIIGKLVIASAVVLDVFGNAKAASSFFRNFSVGY